MMLVLVWIILSLIVAMMGEKKTIGFGGALIVSIILSPLIGFFFVVFSADVVKSVPKIFTGSAADELLKLSDLKERGIISVEEFEKQKVRLLK